MRSNLIACSAAVLTLGGGMALAQSPQLGGEMKHIMVHLHGNMLEGHVDPIVPTPIMRDYGQVYTGNAGVLSGTMYNAQYGWMVDGFWAPPVGSHLWIEQITATAGLRVYSGGTMMNQGTFAPIFGTAGSSARIMWSGSMLHNWYAVDQAGSFEATYRIYFGDAVGAPTPGYMADEVQLNWTAVPAPGTACVMALAAVLARRRR